MDIVKKNGLNNSNEITL